MLTRKINAYYLFVQIGCIAQGALQYLCTGHSAKVWESFRGWLRTMRKDIAPSEQVASLALQHAIPEFLAVEAQSFKLREIIGPNLALERLPCVRMGAQLLKSVDFGILADLVARYFRRDGRSAPAFWPIGAGEVMTLKDLKVMWEIRFK